MRPIEALRARRAGKTPRPGLVTGPLSDDARLASLPRRKPISDVTILADLVSKYTQAFKTPTGTMVLREVQALALHEAIQTQGLFGNIGVARGKTLLSLLLCVALDAYPAVLLIPAGLKAQLLQKAYPALLKHWRLPEIRVLGNAAKPDGKLTVITHNELSNPRYRDVLELIQPRLLVIDEAHAFAGDSARSRRLYAYKNQRPDAMVCVMAGTLIDGCELYGAAGLARLVFGDRSPFPLYKRTVKDLADRLEHDTAARKALHSRVAETLGVVTASGRLNIGASLQIRRLPLAVGPAAKTALKTLRDTWTTPSRDELTDILETHRHALELSQGFCYRWAWPGGLVDEAWMAARRAWSKAVRRKLQRPQPGMDSEALLADAAREGRWVCDAYAPWAAVKSRPPPTVADWVDDFLVKRAVEWGRAKPGIIWYQHTIVGEAIAKGGDFRLYDGGPKCAADILQEDGSETIVVSRPAHGTGLELEAFSRMCLLCPPASAKGWEQVLGRVMRSAQKAARVEVDVCLHTPELRGAFEGALQEARFLQETAPGAENQLILFADLDV